MLIRPTQSKSNRPVWSLISWVPLTVLDIVITLGIGSGVIVGKPAGVLGGVNLADGQKQVEV